MSAKKPCGQAATRAYLVTITMADGSVDAHWGAYPNAFVATVRAMLEFPAYTDIHVRAKP